MDNDVRGMVDKLTEHVNSFSKSSPLFAESILV
jgi:hypothetical protein